VTDEARGGWRAAAACTGLGPSLFYSSSPAAVRRAKALCVGCAVRRECGSHAAATGEFGVWGGRTEAERECGVTSKPGPSPTFNDEELVALFTSCDSTVLAATLLRRRAALSRRIIYKYLGRAQALGLIERRGDYLYPARH
jgi:WhiB family transcriptional regulator, redox-sensing transcriptional regulator